MDTLVSTVATYGIETSAVKSDFGSKDFGFQDNSESTLYLHGTYHSMQVLIFNTSGFFLKIVRLMSHKIYTI